MSLDASPAAASPLTPAAIRDFAVGLSGTVLAPSHPEFDATAAVRQLAATGRPALLVRPADTADVARAVAFARRHGLEIAIRGGGHSGAGHSTGDGVLVIDTRDLREISIDPDGRRLRAGAGLPAGDVIDAAAVYGLTVPFGDTASVGIAGITLGGGLGYLSRQHGLTIDNVLAIELVTADGRVVTASEASEPELFWALRGGGGNFGVVTAVEYRLVEAGNVYGGGLLLPATWNVLRGLAPLAGAAPRELGIIANYMPAPPAPFVPAEAVGQPVVAILGVFNGDPAAGEAAWAPFRALATPIADTVGLMPYPVIYKYTEAASLPTVSAHRSVFLDTVDDTVVEALRDAYAASPAPMTMLQLRVLGGAIADVPNGATAYAHRTAPALVFAYAATPDPAAIDACRRWADEFLDRLRSRGIGTYVNFLEDEGEARIRDAYPASTYRRLAAVKAAWDPQNVFRRNQNIRPAG
jgi:FAD/FMN-containing dehydrogenase